MKTFKPRLPSDGPRTYQPGEVVRPRTYQPPPAEPATLALNVRDRIVAAVSARNAALDRLNVALRNCEAAFRERFPGKATAIEFDDGAAALLYWNGLFVLDAKGRSTPLLNADLARRRAAIPLFAELAHQLLDEDEDPLEPR